MWSVYESTTRISCCPVRGPSNRAVKLLAAESMLIAPIDIPVKGGNLLRLSSACHESPRENIDVVFVINFLKLK